MSKIISYMADKIFDTFQYIGITFPTFTIVSKVLLSLFMIVININIFIGTGVVFAGAVSGAGMVGVVGVLKNINHK